MSTQLDQLGWELLNHGGLLVDVPRLRTLAADTPAPLSPRTVDEFRSKAIAFHEGASGAGEWVSWVLEHICGFRSAAGTWTRGSAIGSEWSRKVLTGEQIKPRQLWQGDPAGRLPVFVDEDHEHIGKGRGRKLVSDVLQWMRASDHKLALLTNGRQWRLLYAGLDSQAWCEWDADRWFEEGGLGQQVNILRLLLSPAKFTASSADAPGMLLQAVQDSRKGQAELSALLGERVREAVELLVQAHGEQLKTQCADVEPADIYRAAVRMVMRVVVVLFAESRDLLPRSSSLYHRAYGLHGLLEELERSGGARGERLTGSFGAWPRMLSLFRLVHQGSPHPALPIHAYGGELFESGEPDSVDGLKRALAVFEKACYATQLMSDREVRTLLERISRTRVKVRQGRSTTWVNTPVDFADLSSEYIGILYEGLLDFELRTAPAEDPVVFLAVGNEPALPLSRLEGMTDAQLKSLLEKMKDTSKKGDDDEEVEEEDSTAETGEDESEESQEEVQEEVGTEEEDIDHRHSTRTRAEEWARRVVVTAGLVKKPPTSASAERRATYERDLGSKARALVRRVVLPGEWFLVRWGGTRKGSGTFYTRPGLAVPTVHRTLRPLAYDAPLGTDAKPDMLAPPTQWTPKKPEEILSLKVCDPACGSGSFPVAALRFLTEAVYASLHQHNRINTQEDRALVALLQEGAGDPETLGTELIPARPDDETFEARLKARLRRHVVERCIYGVDLDPLAVELCRLALWVETMDRDLPFSFLDHKIKCGNGLVGAWFDQFQHYPVMAWKNREGGDKNHSNGVHYEKNGRTKTIRKWVKEKLTPDLHVFFQGRTLFAENLHEAAANAHEDALAVLSLLHEMPVHASAERSRLYRENLLGSYAFQRLKSAMDLWCACWFWPVDKIDIAPLPTNFHKHSHEIQAISSSLANKHKFFHWQLEFSDVFIKNGDGFDAVIGNPPWEVLQPNGEEFFSNENPLYRSYGRTEKVRAQTLLFQVRAQEEKWLEYSSFFNEMSNYVSCSANPFGDPLYSDASGSFKLGPGERDGILHKQWRDYRSKEGDNTNWPYRYQLGRIFTYRLFLEKAHYLLREGGYLGMVVPSGIYSDAWSAPLRRLFVEHSNMKWLFSFENTKKIFTVGGSLRFTVVIIQKGGTTQDSIRTAFMRVELEDWEHGDSLAIPYSPSLLKQLSADSYAFIEINSEVELSVITTMYERGLALADDSTGWKIRPQLEFMMNTDAKLFPPVKTWLDKNFVIDEYGRLVLGKWESVSVQDLRRTEEGNGSFLSSLDGAHVIQESNIHNIALPLMQGRMVWSYAYSRSGFDGQWIRNSDVSGVISSKYAMEQKIAVDNGADIFWRIGFRSVQNSVLERTLVSTMLPHYPAGNSITLLDAGGDPSVISILPFLNNFAVDFLVKKRSNANLNWHIIKELPVIRKDRVLQIPQLHYFTHRLSASGTVMAPHWIRLNELDSRLAMVPWRRHWAVTRLSRLGLDSALQAVGFKLFGLTISQVRVIMADVDYPRQSLNRRRSNGELDEKSFWKVDRDLEPELRHSVLSIVAFMELEKEIEHSQGDIIAGINAFLGRNNGEGWLVPDKLCLADYGLGHDERAQMAQPVASRLGPRYYDWQLAQTPEESWKECHLHARNLLGETGYQQLLERIEAEKRGEEWQPPVVAEPQAEYGSESTTGQQQLF